VAWWTYPSGRRSTALVGRPADWFSWTALSVLHTPYGSPRASGTWYQCDTCYEPFLHGSARWGGGCVRRRPTVCLPQPAAVALGWHQERKKHLIASRRHRRPIDHAGASPRKGWDAWSSLASSRESRQDRPQLDSTHGRPLEIHGAQPFTTAQYRQDRKRGGTVSWTIQDRTPNIQFRS
jgi:hypothetical protein